jgi:hypothetical protein
MTRMIELIMRQKQAKRAVANPFRITKACTTLDAERADVEKQTGVGSEVMSVGTDVLPEN